MTEAEMIAKATLMHNLINELAMLNTVEAIKDKIIADGVNFDASQKRGKDSTYRRCSTCPIAEWAKIKTGDVWDIGLVQMQIGDLSSTRVGLPTTIRAFIRWADQDASDKYFECHPWEHR